MSEQKNITVKVGKRQQETRTVELPSYPGSKVELYESLMVETSRNLSKNMEEEKDDFMRGIKRIAAYIKDWNLVGDDGKKIEISADSICNYLEERDLNVLSDNTVFKKKAEKSAQNSG